jgi:nitroreductase
MDVLETIATRRSVKRFTDGVPARAEVERLLEAAVLAPNHRMTEPWRFIVLGPETKAVYAEVRARLRSEKLTDAAAAEAIRTKVRQDVGGVPLMIAVAMEQAEDPAVREEDYAAVWMAIQNLSLAAVSLGLGTYVRTGRIMEDAELRAALRVPTEWRIVALLDVGEPAELPPRKPRVSAAQRTSWLP